MSYSCSWMVLCCIRVRLSNQYLRHQYWSFDYGLPHRWNEWMNEMFYLTTHSTHFIYGYMASDIWLRTILIVRKVIRCRHMGYYFRLTAMVLLYAPSHRQDSTYHGLCYTSRGALAGTRNSSIGPHTLTHTHTHTHTMKDQSDDPSHHERTLLPRSYISLHLTVKSYIWCWCMVLWSIRVCLEAQ